MKDKNENRHGYKKTKVGWIPEEWDVMRLEEMVEEHNAGIYKKRELYGSGNNIVGVSDLYGIFRINGQGFRQVPLTQEDLEKYMLHEGDLIYGESSLVREGIARTLYVAENGAGTAFAWHTRRYKVNRKKICPIYLYYFLESYSARKFMISISTQTALTGITTEDYFRCPIPVPRLPEQKKIAEILATWDKAIEQTRELLNAKISRKKALMQQLLTGKMRFKDNGGNDWCIKPLGELVEPVLRPVPKPKEPYLSIGLRSHGRGAFQKIVELPEKVMMDTLYRIESQDIIVNITFAWEGAIAIAKENDSGGLVSHRFPTYRIKDKKANIDFFRNMILTKKFVWDLGLISPGGAGRNRVMSKKDFMKLKVIVPPIEIQKEIGKILTTADNEINVLEDYRNALDQQKRGLMQKLLTGEVRVKL